MQVAHLILSMSYLVIAVTELGLQSFIFKRSAAQVTLQDSA